MINKITGKMLPQHYQAEGLGFIHIINAYEEDGNIVLDAPFNPRKTGYDFVMMDVLKGDKIADLMARKGPFVGPAMRFKLLTGMQQGSHVLKLVD